MDPKWNETCELVDKRDHGTCRLLKVLTPGETKLLNGKGKCGTQRAHVFARSIEPGEIYNPANIVTINAWSHKQLDDCHCPITGKAISKNLVYYWWKRILNKSTETFDPDIEYLQEVKQIIGI